jgi:hypothetical protein
VVADPVATTQERATEKPDWMVAHDRARALIASWAQAQRDLDLDAYLRHYAPDATGYRRTFGGATLIEIGIPDVSSGGDDKDVIIELTERRRRGTFSDHSALSLVIDTAGTPRITSVRSAWSRPGWGDAEAPIFDALDMTPPISVKVRTAGGDAGDCVTRAAIVELTDAVGVTAEIPIRTDADRALATHTLVPAGGTYAWTDACAGIRIEHSIFRYHDRVELLETWDDDAAGSGRYAHSVAALPFRGEIRFR